MLIVLSPVLPNIYVFTHSNVNDVAKSILDLYSAIIAKLLRVRPTLCTLVR